MRQHNTSWPGRVRQAARWAPGGRHSVKRGIPGGVRGRAHRCCPAGLRWLWRYDEEGAMTNIRTPIGFSPHRLAALPAGLAMAPCSCRERHWGSVSRGDGIILLQPVAGVGLMQAHAPATAWWAT